MGPKVLLLTSNDGTQSGRSGYDVLADYLPVEKKIVRFPRSDPSGLLARIQRRILIQRSASRSYLLSSQELEKRAQTAAASFQPELIHFLWGDRDWGYLDRWCMKRGIPMVCTIHGCPDSLEKIFIRRERLLNPSAFVLMSSHQKPFFLRAGVPEERLNVIHHGIDAEHFRPAEEAGSTEGFTILSVGHTRRNFPLMTRLIERMKDDGVRFRVISKPAFRDAFAGHDHVKFESNLSNEALLEAYQRASVLILTAEDATANNALLEGMACGLPVVSEAVGGLPEYCGDEAAILCPANEVEPLREGILRLKNDAGQHERMSAAARERALELAWEHSAARICDLYERVGRTVGKEAR